MRNKSFEKLLKDAIVLAAEERGTRLDREPVEPAPFVAQARLDAVLNGKRKEPKRTASDASSEQPKKLAQRRLTYVLTAVSATAVVLVAVFLIGTGGLLGTKSVKDAVMPTEQPLMQTETTAAPGAPGEQELGEPLPNTRVTFADENAANVAMMRFYEEKRTLLMAVAEDMKAPEHGYIVNGVVYSINGSYVDRDHPYASMTDSIKAFLDLPDSVDYVLFWNDSIFHVSLRWTNDSGYYSTELVFAEDGQKIVMTMYEKGGTTLEPVYEDSAWGVYTVCWQTAPFHAGSSYAPEQAIGVWETDDVPFLYLELFDDGTARILHLFGDYDIRAHYAWDYDRDSIRITFSDQTVVSTAELHINTDTMTLTLADGSTVEATRVSYRLIVNGQEVPVDSIFQEYAKGEVHLMIPVTAVFRGIGCETEVKGDTVEIRRDEALWLVLDLEAHTLTDPDDPEYNYFMIAPGDTLSDFKRQRSGDELWVRSTYVDDAFQLLGMPTLSYYDENSNEMRVTIENVK